ncbi:hypothetical protein [Photorhabdus khanii]|uniref:Uncharacterized protein n=1 Tax=Photorhabdus khanii subsp. guanajuatensis TaxID=2100166 RepID=A0A4R4INB6_9GAMM|nr:hypothetical protein [Photorhabdus khanii]TDB42080.1 hypothetical protein C5467_24130 [Photorhabdus khanii subsp. guanajuatensis]
MGCQNKPHTFGVTSVSREPKVTHNRRQAHKLTPEEFLSLNAVKEYLAIYPDSVRRDPDTDEIWLNKTLMMMYLDLCQEKKFKKTFDKRSGE